MKTNAITQQCAIIFELLFFFFCFLPDIALLVNAHTEKVAPFNRQLQSLYFTFTLPPFIVIVGLAF